MERALTQEDVEIAKRIAERVGNPKLFLMKPEDHQIQGGYFVEWDESPGIPVFTIDYKVKEWLEDLQS